MSSWAFMAVMMFALSCVALGGHAFAQSLRRKGHGDTLDRLHDKTVGFQEKVRLSSARFLLSRRRPPPPPEQ